MKRYNLKLTAFGSGPDSGGFVDTRSQQQHEELPSDIDVSKDKVRGYIRYLFILQQLGLLGVFDVEVVKNDSTGTSDATEIELNLTFQSDIVYGHFDGVVMDNLDAVKNAIAVALSITSTQNTEWIDPTKSTSVNDEGTSEAGIRKAYAFETLTIGGLAASPADALASINLTEV